MNCRDIVGKIIQIAILCMGLMLAAFTMALLARPLPAVAAGGPALPGATLRSSAVFTRSVFLPIIVRSPSPEYQLVDLINAERARRGLCALRINPVLMQTAEAHSQDMVTRNYFDHTNPDGQAPWDRLTEAGYAWSWAGENIGAGYTTAKAMFDGWMASTAGHREIMLTDQCAEIGVGYATGGRYGHYWTADFAVPQ